MMRANYEKGALHNDHHKEINIQAAIMTEESLAQLITDFMGGEDMRADKAPKAGFVQDAETIVPEESGDSGELNPSGDSESSPSYPPITEAQERFFDQRYRNRGTYRLNSDSKEEQTLPMEQLLHRLYDYTHNHNSCWDPKLKTCAHWKMLYDMLHRRGIIQEQKSPRYRDFVRAVVSYCYPETAEKYANNISKTSSLPDCIWQWPDEDKAELRKIKKEVLGEMG